jgi:hypothetical protein
MRQEFFDFEIHIPARQDDNRQPVLVTKSPVGSVFGSFELPFDEAGLAAALSGLDASIAQSQLVRSTAAAQGVTRGVTIAEDEQRHNAKVREFGTTLFNALFAGDVAKAFRESTFKARSERKGLRVRMRIEEAKLSALPWEFLYDPHAGDFICLQSDTPLVRYLQIDRPIDVLRVKPPIRILAMISSPRGHAALDVDQEKRRIEQATEGMRGAGLLEIVWMQAATVDALQKALRTGEYHVFHYVGHGGFDAALGKGVLIFSTESGDAHILDAAMLARILAREDTLRLVVLNSCLGAKGSATDLFSSTAATLVRGGVPSVVGMQYEISDEAAIRFARTLYDSIGDGLPIDAAVAEARVTLSTDGDSVEWGTPVLHMLAPDGVLFEINGMRTSEARSSGVYKTLARPQPAAMVETAPPTAPVIPPPSPPPMPVVTATPVEPPARSVDVKVGPSRTRSSLKTAVIVTALVGAVGIAAMMSSDPGYTSEAGVEADGAVPTVDSSAVAADTALDGWITGFAHVQGPDRAWIRLDQTCRWSERFIQEADTQFIDYVQVASGPNEIELFDRAHMVTLFIPRTGGWVSADSGGGRPLVNSGVRVTPELEGVPAQLPECEQAVFDR